MNPNTSTEPVLAIVARKSPMRPKPTKREILQATALALHSEDCKRHGEAEQAFESEKAKRIAQLLLVAERHFHLGEVEVEKWYPKLKISFRPNESHPTELNHALKEFHKWYQVAYDQLPKIRSVTDLVKELKEATSDAEDRIFSILQDETARKSLIEEGTRLLGGAQ